MATSINDRGEVVGTALLSDGTIHAFLWTRQRGMQDLGLPANDFVSVATCCHTINNRGEVVGFSFPGPLGGGRALLWVDKVPVDLEHADPGRLALVPSICVVDQRRRRDRGLGHDQW